MSSTGSTDGGSANFQQIPCPSSEEYHDHDNDFGLSRLQERASWLVDNHEKLGGKICLAIAGGGGHALSTLAATPGASQLLLEGTVTYDRMSFQMYVGQTLPDNKIFSYSSLEAAQLASRRALLQALQLQTSSNNPMTFRKLAHTIGVGSASTLKTTTPGGTSKSGRPSHGNIVATTALGQETWINVTLNCPQQNRFQQDLSLSHMILLALETTAKQHQSKEFSGQQGASMSESIVHGRHFQGITIHQSIAPNIHHTTKKSQPEGESSHDPVQVAAHRILDGEVKAVLLLPRETATTKEDGSFTPGDCSFLQPLVYPVLPSNCLIFPGSYNPPHEGHIKLANSTVTKVHAKSDNSQAPPPIVFEISITNADKPAMDPVEVARRVSYFRDLLLLPNGQSTDNRPIKEWGILLTSAPLFAEKMRDLKRYAPPPRQPLNKHKNSGETVQQQDAPKWSFVIGTDTMVRILNPKYYNNDYDQMIEAQRSMGAGFVVGGRQEQDKDGDAPFVTGQELLDGLPEDVQSLFTILDESDFRVDISSTEIRARMQGQAQPQNNGR